MFCLPMSHKNSVLEWALYNQLILSFSREGNKSIG